MTPKFVLFLVGLLVSMFPASDGLEISSEIINLKDNFGKGYGNGLPQSVPINDTQSINKAFNGSSMENKKFSSTNEENVGEAKSVMKQVFFTKVDINNSTSVDVSNSSFLEKNDTSNSNNVTVPFMDVENEEPPKQNIIGICLLIISILVAVGIMYLYLLKNNLGSRVEPYSWC